MPDPFPYEYYVSYLNTAEVQAAIGAYQNFSESSEAVYQAFTATGDDNREDGTIQAIKKLLDQGIYVFQYAGDADYKYVLTHFERLEARTRLMNEKVATGSAAKSFLRKSMQQASIPQVTPISAPQMVSSTAK
jgi:hypothetical protein